MPILHLGVMDIPYSGTGGATTGDVAGWLEDGYGVMQFYFDRHQHEVADFLADAMAGSLETMMMGGPQQLNLGTAEGKIDQSFREFLDNREMDGQVFGVPTLAAMTGVSHRFAKRRNKGKGGRAPGTSRPSFIDTGLYQANFKSWVD